MVNYAKYEFVSDTTYSFYYLARLIKTKVSNIDGSPNKNISSKLGITLYLIVNSKIKNKHISHMTGR